MHRRTLIKAGIAAAVAVPMGVLGYTIEVEPHWLEIVHRDLPIRNLPDALVGRTMAQLSDLHIGPDVSDKYMVESFARVAALRPDIVVYTGDYITYAHSRGASQFAQLREVFAHAPRGRLASVGVYGNHDYGWNWSEPEVARKVAIEVEKAGVQILSNDVATVAGLDIVGVDDYWASRSNPHRALWKRPSNAAIVLCHNPDAQDALEWEDYSGWVLSGHTHGGQCKPPFLPPPLLPVKNRRYVKGEVVVNDRRTMYINRGVGHLIQARFNVRPEITMFTLRRGAT